MNDIKQYCLVNNSLLNNLINIPLENHHNIELSESVCIELVINNFDKIRFRLQYLYELKPIIYNILLYPVHTEIINEINGTTILLNKENDILYIQIVSFNYSAEIKYKINKVLTDEFIRILNHLVKYY